MKGYRHKEAIAERIKKFSDPDNLYISLFNIRQQSDHIKHRAFSDRKPRYNSNVKTYSRDSYYLMEEMIQLIEYLVFKIEQLENGGGF